MDDATLDRIADALWQDKEAIEGCRWFANAADAPMVRRGFSKLLIRRMLAHIESEAGLVLAPKAQ